MGFLERYSFLKKTQKTTNFTETRREDRTWENGYRNRFSYDKVVRSTHGVNCTGSCSWQIFVKNGIITYEMQQNDYPQTQENLPEYEPRGCPSGASYSSYLYSPHRIKHPMIRGELLKFYREKRKTLNPIEAWKAIVESPESKIYKQKRGSGGFVRINYDEALEIIAAANIYTIKTYGPDRIFGFSPIPAMSMVSYASGSRYLSLIGAVVGSFYDWYCDLPPSSPQVFGEQTDVPESADWYNSTYLMLWGSNVPQTRRPDAHFYTEVRYKGTKTVVISPDFSEASKFADVWVALKPGTDAALALAIGHVIFKEFHIDNSYDYFTDYVKHYSDMPFLITLKNVGDYFVPDRFLRASDIGKSDEFRDWKTVVIDNNTNELSVINGSIGFRYQNNGKWNLHSKDAIKDLDINPKLSLMDISNEICQVAFPDFVNNSTVKRKVAALKIKENNNEYLVASVFDLLAAHYGIDRGLNDSNAAKSYDEECAYTPAWQEKITGVKKELVIKIAREFAQNALATKGKSMVIIGAGVNHYYYTDTIYRSVINMLTMCGCIGQSGGGWAHYVGQEKVRPLAGWSAIAFALDWYRPPKQMNSTSFYYFHTDQFRYEDVKIEDLLSPLADATYKNYTPADFNVKAIRMGWLPSAPYVDKNPIEIVKEAQSKNVDPKEYLIAKIKESNIKFSFEDPDNPVNFVRNMFVWRSNLLGASSKGHEYFLKHLLGAKSGILAKETDQTNRPKEIVWHDSAPIGKLDLLVTLDFRMSTTCIYSDIVLPVASWYEKEDLSTTDMHPFIHPFSKALDPLWESKSDWDMFKDLSKKFSELASDFLGSQTELVLSPQMHDTQTELAQAFEPKDWKIDNVEIVPGKNFPSIGIIVRDYPNVYKQYISLGPLLDKLGNGAKGVSWDTKQEIEFLKRLNGEIDNRPKIESAKDVCEAILELAPETNGQVSHKAFDNLSLKTGDKHTTVRPPIDYALRFFDLQVQPRRTVTSPIWSGIESKEIPYNASYQNVHEFIPWHTLTGRIQFYQDHEWMQLFGESFAIYKPPINARSLTNVDVSEGTLMLKWSTAHQKFGIHSTYVDLLILQTLSRGGPHIWISQADAKSLGIADNDWIEAYNKNGVVVARAVVSQRIPQGSAFMYHAQDKIINTPISDRTSTRGGVHNSVIKVLLNPVHMIGGYAQLSYSFNYYGTVGSNRDDFVLIKKINKPAWSSPQKTMEAL